MSFKTPILILFLLLPLLSFSQQLQVNIFGGEPTAFLQDTVTQKVILEFIEEAQVSADDFFRNSRKSAGYQYKAVPKES